MVDDRSMKATATKRHGDGWLLQGCAQPAGQAELPLHPSSGAWGVNAGNLCPKTMPFVFLLRPSVRSSIHLLRCACCVKCKGAPPYSLPVLSQSFHHRSMHAWMPFALLLIYACSCHSYFSLANANYPLLHNPSPPSDRSLLGLFRTLVGPCSSV